MNKIVNDENNYYVRKTIKKQDLKDNFAFNVSCSDFFLKKKVEKVLDIILFDNGNAVELSIRKLMDNNSKKISDIMAQDIISLNWILNSLYFSLLIKNLTNIFTKKVDEEKELKNKSKANSFEENYIKEARGVFIDAYSIKNFKSESLSFIRNPMNNDLLLNKTLRIETLGSKVKINFSKKIKTVLVPEEILPEKLRKVFNVG